MCFLNSGIQLGDSVNTVKYGGIVVILGSSVQDSGSDRAEKAWLTVAEIWDPEVI